jgi:integrase
MLFWEKEEFDTFIKVVDDPIFLALFSLLYWTGMRIGEAQALQIKDIDFDNNTITVSKTYNAIHKELTTP